MSPRVANVFSLLFLAIGLGCAAAGGWLWWTDGVPAPVLAVEPLQVGAVATGVDHPVEIPVVNTGREAIRLAGIDGEWC